MKAMRLSMPTGYLTLPMATTHHVCYRQIAQAITAAVSVKSRGWEVPRRRYNTRCWFVLRAIQYFVMSWVR